MIETISSDEANAVAVPGAVAVDAAPTPGVYISLRRAADSAPVPGAPAVPHPAHAILTEIEALLRDLDAIPAHIAAVVKAKLSEAKSRL